MLITYTYMKTYKIILFFYFFIFFSCNVKNNEKNIKGADLNSNENEKSTIISKNDTKPVINSESKDIIYRKLIIGIWGEDINENAIFIVEKDSSRNLDHGLIPYHYFIRNDSFIIEMDEELYSSKILKLDEDSLILSSDGFVSPYVRFKR